MPTLPTYDNFAVQAAALPGGRQNVPAAAGELQALGDTQQRAGQQLVGMGAEMQQRTDEAAARADAVRVDAALNKAKLLIGSATYDPDNGYLAKKGEAAFPKDKPLDETYAEQIRAQLGEISATLGNDRQRALFNQHAEPAVTQFQVSIKSHAAQEFQRYGQETNKATVDLAVQAAAATPYDVKNIGIQIDTGIQAIEKNAHAQGIPLDSPIVKEQKLKMSSAIHSQTIAAALEDKHADYASAYLKEYSKDMTAHDILAVKGHIVMADEAERSDNSATRVMAQAAPTFNPTPEGKFEHVTTMMESGGNQFRDDGSPMTSPKGATGKWQVLPTTGPEAAQLAGLEWNPELFNARRTGDPAQDEKAIRYNEALGKAYLHKQLRDFGGDIEKAWAAYNHGPEGTRKAIARAEKEGVDWKTYLPKETKAYISKGNDMLGSPEAKPSRPTLEALTQQALADPELGPNPSPSLKKLVQDNVRRKYEAHTEALKQAGVEAENNVQRWAYAHPGAGMSDVPPALMAKVVEYSPEKLDNLKTFIKSFNNPDRETDNKVYGALVSDDAMLKNLDEATFQHILATKLSPSDARSIMNKRGALLNGASKNPSENIDDTAINRATDSRLVSLEVNVSPKKGDAKAMEKLGGVRRFVRDDIARAQQQAGRALTDVEITQRVDFMFSKSVALQNIIKGVDIPYGSVEYEPLMSPDLEVPQDREKYIRQWFAERGNPNPTDTDIVNAYRGMKLYAK